MPDKALAFAQMADQKAMEIMRSYQSWTAFLTTAARLYKYPYHEQLLIYAQRPDATACAEFGLWTETMRRYVRRGSKGIGLVDMSGNAPRLRYVFDISDTGGREDSRRPFIWQLEEKHLDAVQAMLAIRYDEDAPYFPQQLELIANKLAAEYWEDHKRDILDIIDDTYLSDYDEYNVGVTFRKAAGVSIAYMLIARCDLEPEESFSHEDFMSIFDFNTPQAVFALGTAVSQISQRVLRQIEAVVKNAERSIENERTDLYPERGLSDPEPDVGRNGNQAPGQVRDDAETIPDGAATDPVQFPATQREITEPSAGNRADSADPPGTDDGQNAPGSGPDRENESGESDGVGGSNEWAESPGRGNPAERTDLQLTEESENENAGGDPPAFSIDGRADLPDDGATEDGNWNDLALPQPDTLQTSLFDAEIISAETLSAPLPPRQGIRYAHQIVDEALAVGGFDINSRLTIAAYFMKNKPMEDNARFLAEHYGVNGTGFYLNDRQYAMWYDQNGIRLASGETSQGLSSQLISWEQAAQRIRELLDEGRYMTQDELDRAPEFELEELASDLVFFRRDLSEEAKEQGYLPTIGAISEERISFDEMQSRLVALMKQPETLVALENELSRFMTAYAENRDLFRFRYHKQGKYLQRLQDLQRDPLIFTAAPAFDPQHRYFISMDQIDRILHGGNDSTEYRLAVYAYFRNHPLPKDQENYMKNYHGQYSGQSSINYDLLYTTKSFSYRRTYRDAPPAEIEWKWNKAAKRIQTLIQQGRFLTDADRAAMPDYERKQIAMQIVRAFSDAPPEIQRPFGHNDILEFWDAVKEVQPQLTDPQRIEEIYRSLVSLTEMTLPNDRHLTTRQQTLQTMTDFIEGKYGLFGERVQPVFSFSISDNQDKTEERADNIPTEQQEEIPPSLDSPSAADAVQEDLPLDAPAPIHRALTQDDIDAALLEWNGSSESKQAVVRYMQVHARDREAAAWLRGEYGDDLPAFPVTAGGAAGDVSWTKVQRRIAQLIREGHFLTEEKQDDISAPVPEEKQTEKPAKRIAQTMDELLTPLTLEQVIEYNSIKEHYPDAWVGYEQMGNYLFFGEEAKQVSEILGTHVFEKEFPGGKISFTGFPASRWYSSSKKLWSKGHDIYLAGETDDGTHTEVKHYLARDYLPIHDTVMIDGREFQIDQVDFQHDKVSLLDMTLLRESRYPMFRVESIEDVRYYWEKTEESIDLSDKNMDGQILSPEIDRESESPRVIVPEDRLLTRAINLTENDRQEARQDHHAAAPAAENQEKAENFRITDLTLGQVGQKSKFRANLNAIYVLKLIESENRQATPEEQEVLSRYVGWGGIADAFDESKTAWVKEYAELKDALTPEEYSAARASTLNAHYTSPTVIQAMYEALGNMGFQTGNILEPAMGVGNFFGMLPETMRGSKLYGVELDSISGRIARQLYPNADIRVAGFETTDRRDFYDLAVGNVPFGNYKVHDRAYDKLGFNIHNYFFAKSLDQVRPGGIVAFVTSRYTMDAKSPEVRKYLAQRADLLGAIRLPNNAFKANAGTDVTTDIVFLQKRDRPMDIEPDWVHLGETEDGIPINSYYIDHPSMVLGTMAWDKSMYGDERETTCNPIEGAQLSEQLSEAIRSITGSYQAAELPDLAEGEEISDSIPADPSVKNYSYTVVDGEVYYRQNSVMVRPALNQTAQERVKGMVALRDCVHRLMDAQVDDEDEAVIRARQAELNTMYDRFTKRHGLINSRGNSLAFADDPSYYLLCSLEILDEDGNLERKADMFTKRTIRQRREITHVDTAMEALAVSIGERACVDLEYMASLMGGEDKIPQIVRDLHGVIFKDPETGPFDMENEETRYKGWQNADEYLSGNVRQKLRIARQAAEQNPQFQVNVTSLETVQPKDLDASEIDVRLGATWVDKQYIEQFMYELFKTPESLQHYDEWGGFNRDAVIVQFSEYTAEWRIANKSAISGSDVAAYTTYGTEDMSAYEILEHTLNLRDVRIFETVEDAEGHERRVVNAKRTTLAQQKQQAIKDAFRDWIWNDPERRMALMSKYNEVFNSTRPREYDGQHIVFTGMTPEISLREHQRNAIAHILYGGNALLAHQVGAGKTFEMVAAVMESKRLGLCQKAMIVVPNHLTEQWASEFLRLYPSANILVTTKKDFEKNNRKKFCSRIATGEYDAVIIGHSQFEKIPVSIERQEQFIHHQIQEVMDALESMRDDEDENRFSIKQLERSKKRLEARLEKIHDNYRKDDVVTFEQLGVDRLYVDEAHAFKNLYLYTKMNNVAGLSTTEAQKSSDMFLKCRYIDEITDGRGIVFATGTPVSNSMTELYTMQRYLQYRALQENGFSHFDCWVSTFGETTTTMELAPEGTGYRARTRFARFFNLPELMNLFKAVADIKTADQLHLPTPNAHFETIVVQPTEEQKEIVQSLAARAARVHSGSVDPKIDNMLTITSDGRKLGLDQRLINPMLPDDPGSKVNACIDNVFRLWDEGKAEKLTQLIFCDLSTPKTGASARSMQMAAKAPPETINGAAMPVPAPEIEDHDRFSVYDDIRSKLIACGIPLEQIAFIHDANTEIRKKELFAKVRSGQVRVLLGSTAKMGAGTNVQDRLIAIHDLDCPWRPGDLEQRAGRIIRQGNNNEDVFIYRYVTEGTFDAYLWQTVENKQKFISQIMTSKSPVRSCEDVDETALSYAEIKALCAGDPRIKEKIDLDVDVARLRLMKSQHETNRHILENRLVRFFPEQIELNKSILRGLEQDLALAASHPLPQDGFVGMEINGDYLTDKENAGAALIQACKDFTKEKVSAIGHYRGFALKLEYDSLFNKFYLTIQGALSHRIEMSSSVIGNLQRIENELNRIPQQIEDAKARIDNLEKQVIAAAAEKDKPFPQEEELAEKSARLALLNAELDIDGQIAAAAKKEESLNDRVAKKPYPSIMERLNQPCPMNTAHRKNQQEVR